MGYQLRARRAASQQTPVDQVDDSVRSSDVARVAVDLPVLRFDYAVRLVPVDGHVDQDCPGAFEGGQKPGRGLVAPRPGLQVTRHSAAEDALNIDVAPVLAGFGRGLEHVRFMAGPHPAAVVPQHLDAAAQSLHCQQLVGKRLDQLPRDTVRRHGLGDHVEIVLELRTVLFGVEVSLSSLEQLCYALALKVGRVGPFGQAIGFHAPDSTTARRQA